MLRLAILFALLIAARPLAAQGQDPRLVPGTRVRVTAEELGWNRVEARIVGLSADTLVVVARGQDQARLAPGMTSTVQVVARPSRRRAYAWSGAGLGALVGFLGVSQALVGGSVGDGVGAEYLYGAFLGAPAGAFLGAAIGFQMGEERWETVPLVPQGPRIGLRLQVP